MARRRPNCHGSIGWHLDLSKKTRAKKDLKITSWLNVHDLVVSTPCICPGPTCYHQNKTPAKLAHRSSLGCRTVLDPTGHLRESCLGCFNQLLQLQPHNFVLKPTCCCDNTGCKTQWFQMFSVHQEPSQSHYQDGVANHHRHLEQVKVARGGNSKKTFKK